MTITINPRPQLTSRYITAQNSGGSATVHYQRQGEAEESFKRRVIGEAVDSVMSGARARAGNQVDINFFERGRPLGW